MILSPVALGLALAGPGAQAAAPARAGPDPAAICRAHPNLDYPPGHALPASVAAVEADHWRCMGGRVMVCNGGASGSGCLKMDPSRRPTPIIRDYCADTPEADFVAFAMIGNSASAWRCRGGAPQIIKTQPLDARGFMRRTWGPISHFVESADPR